MEKSILIRDSEVTDITEHGRESPLRKLWDERPLC